MSTPLRRYAFRADASLEIGSGHVMRCLTLADALRARGGECHFICRPHAGHMIDTIRQRGHVAHPLPAPVATLATGYAAWLGADWIADAQQTANLLQPLRPDWLIVDHYALDRRWEKILKADVRYLLVIDDLADRPHECDALLDQNLGSTSRDYQQLVPAHCRLLVGAKYALLRPDFSQLRASSLKRRNTGQLRHILISMGGSDQPNATSQILNALRKCTLPENCQITVVMGAQARWLDQVHEISSMMPWPTNVLHNVNDMAARMAESDLAIGAAGSSSWERCCLGLPAILVCLAENQRMALQHLANAGAILAIDLNNVAQELKNTISKISTADKLTALSLNSAQITDGQGANRVMDIFYE